MAAHLRKSIGVGVVLFSFLFAAIPDSAQALGKKPILNPDRNDKSWVALHIFDSMYPMTDDQTFPAAISSLETLTQLYTKRKAFRDLARFFALPVSGYGDRSREGHFLIWIHLSDQFIAAHPGIRSQVDPYMFLFPDRETDIFTAWSGSVNIAAFLTSGVKGLGMPSYDSNGNVMGNFQTFSEIWPLGDADYEGGWYMNDQQAEKILTSFHSYPGPTRGYSFLRPVSESWNPPAEAPGAQLGNGYNCGDFVFYALTTAGIVSRDEVDSFKIDFWYPLAYFDKALPLKGAGQRGYNWLMANPGQTTIPNNTMISIAWSDLLFGHNGVEFFNKTQLVKEFVQYQYPLQAARLWDQAHAITWLQKTAQFRSKGIYSEIYPALRIGDRITSPERTIPATPRNHWVFSRAHASIESSGDVFQKRKLKQAGIWGLAGDIFTDLFNKLKPQN